MIHKNDENSYYYNKFNGREYVRFDINSQGMLEDQYGGLIFSHNDVYLDGENIRIYDQNKVDANSNNIFIYEKMVKNTWSYFINNNTILHYWYLYLYERVLITYDDDR